MKKSTEGIFQLGKIDRNILRVLQKDGRISYTELARQVGLSVTPCIERVKRLENSGYILGYSAQVCPQKLEAGLVVFVQIRLNHTSQKNFEEFRRSVIELENVQSCFLVSGNYDYLLKARIDLKSTRLNSRSRHSSSYAVFCLKKKKLKPNPTHIFIV